MTDAPKIDTTAPEHPVTARDAVDIMAEILEAASNDWDGKPAAAPEPLVTTPTCGTARRIAATLRALLAERDLAAAQTAAAVREMREAAASACDEGHAGRAWGQIIRALPPADCQAALDRLLEAARQDERTAIAAYIGMSPSEVTDRQYHMEAIRTGRYRDDPLMQRGV